MDLRISSERSPHDPPACSSTMVLKKELAEGGAFQNGRKATQKIHFRTGIIARSS